MNKIILFLTVLLASLTLYAGEQKDGVPVSEGGGGGADGYMSGEAAGGDLTGTYPNPTLDSTANVTNIVTNIVVSAGLGAADGYMSGEAAGGDLTGTYPNPTLATDYISEAELDTLGELNTQLGTSIADGAHTVDTDTTYLDDLSSFTNAVRSAQTNDGFQADTDTTYQDDLPTFTNSVSNVVTTLGLGADGYMSGEAAGGDLTGTYPNPTLATDYISEVELDTLAELNTQLGTSIADGAHTVDTDTTYLDDLPTFTNSVSNVVTTLGLGNDGYMSGEAAGGDLTGTYPNPTLATDYISEAELDTLSELNTQLGTSIADGAHTVDTTLNLAGAETISGDWVNTANPWADNEVSDTITVGAAGSVSASALPADVLLESELTDTDIKTLTLPASATISVFGESLTDDADAATARTTLGVDAAGTDNSTNVTLAGQDYLTLSGQQITANTLNDDDVTDALTLASATIGTSTITLEGAAAPVPTVDGEIHFETDDDHIIIGDGVDQVEFVPTEDVSGDVTMDTAGAVTIAADSVALTTDTTGNYAAGDGEAGAALTGDSASAFFAAGTIEHERGGLELDISAIGIGDVLAGASAGVIEIVDGGAASDGDLLTIQADGTVNFETPVAGGGGTVQGTDGTYDIQATNDGATDGDARGANSVDLSTLRSASTMVASGETATIAGGRDNTASGIESFIGGGEDNIASGLNSVSVGGLNNDATGTESTVGGGQNNTASGVESVIAGGESNLSTGLNSTVGGGLSNEAGADYATASGGRNSHATGVESTVGGGNNNTASGEESVISGGEDNTATAPNSTVGGGKNNDATGTESTVGGGQLNVASGEESTISGGEANTATAINSTVGGGWNNDATGIESTVGGGQGNVASGEESTVSGGEGNTASGAGSVVSGGRLNTASGIDSVVLGATGNQADGNYSIAGGYYSTASGGAGLAIGRDVHSVGNGAMIFGDYVATDITNSLTQSMMLSFQNGLHLVDTDATGSMLFMEEASAANADIAGRGQLWVKSDTPNTLYFTDDAGSDFQIGGAKARGDMYVSSASASDAITAAAYLNVLANATVADGGLTSGFTVDDTNKRITYTGTRTVTVLVSASFSMTSSKSNENSRFRLAENGTTNADTEIIRKIGTGSDTGAASVQGMFSLATNDYIELHGTLDASTSDTITVSKINLSVIVID